MGTYAIENAGDNLDNGDVAKLELSDLAGEFVFICGSTSGLHVPPCHALVQPSRHALAT